MELGILNFFVCKGKELFGKWKIGEVEWLVFGGDRYLLFLFVLFDSFGDIKVFLFDKFGVFRDFEDVERFCFFCCVD